MTNSPRQLRILELLRINGHVRVSDLCQSLSVSEATIRRDLDRLEEHAKLQRTHGGAMLADRASPEPPVLHRMAEGAAVKQWIGEAAADLVHDGDTVFIGSGTTALEVARHLKGREHVTVLTNALTVINELGQQEGITLISIGGLLRPSELSFIGHIAEDALQELRPHKVIMGIRAISLTHGLTSDDIAEVSTDRAIMKSAPEVILVADATKFGKIATAFLAPVTAVHRIVTDSSAPTQLLGKLEALGIEVIVVRNPDFNDGLCGPNDDGAPAITR
jgi:DeoR/GlpR family transcriptional regulator of sugar metabolism